MALKPYNESSFRYQKRSTWIMVSILWLYKMFVLFGVAIVYGGLTDDIHHVIIKAHPK